ncbi:hypothetical protein MTO96_004241 [Rhipicephalus appendiculatus]
MKLRLLEKSRLPPTPPSQHVVRRDKLCEHEHRGSGGKEGKTGSGCSSALHGSEFAASIDAEAEAFILSPGNPGPQERADQIATGHRLNGLRCISRGRQLTPRQTMASALPLLLLLLSVRNPLSTVRDPPLFLLEGQRRSRTHQTEVVALAVVTALGAS